MPALYESEADAQIERELRPWKCVGIFLLRCLILIAEFLAVTALLYWANHALGVRGWLRICTAFALVIWAILAWAALKALINVWVRTAFLRFSAKVIILLSLLLLVDVGLHITFQA